MDVKKMEIDLGVADLKSHLINEIRTSRNEAEIKADDLFNSVLQKLSPDSKFRNGNEVILFGELNLIRRIIYNREVSNINYFLTSFNLFPNSYSLGQNYDQDERLVNFIIENFSFFNETHFSTFTRFKDFISSFQSYFFNYFIEIKSNILFDELNKLNCLPDFNWSLETFDNGILEFYKVLLINNNLSELKLKHENETIRMKSNDKIEYLNNDIESLKREVKFKDQTIAQIQEYVSKYHDNKIVVTIDTYFGDNLPFIYNLYKFLFQYKLLRTTPGWSYFYTCLTTNNSEIINLENKSSSKFIGRVFFNLTTFLCPKYRENNIDFFRDKFYLNEAPINANFFVNHMRTNFDIALYPKLQEVDDFFSKQKEIYLK